MTDLSRTLASWSYRGVEFPGTETSFKWGHDSAKHQGYLQRGSDIETTGQKAAVITVKVSLRNGLRWLGPNRPYPETYNALVAALKVPEGTLLHPTHGMMVVHVDDVSEDIDGKTPDGLDVSITFTEQTSDLVASVLTLAAPSTPSEAALASAADADAAATGLDLSDATILAAQVGDAFDVLQSSQLTYTDATALFDMLLTSVDDRATDLGALLATGHVYREALSRVRVSLLAYRAEYLGAEGPETITLPAEMSLARASVLAYGDAMGCALLASKNRIPDPSFIPAGTVLVV